MMILNVMDENKGIYCFDEILDAKYGKVGTASRERFRKEAEAYCVVDYRKKRRMTGCLRNWPDVGRTVWKWTWWNRSSGNQGQPV